jgi:hypothetical protein
LAFSVFSQNAPAQMNEVDRYSENTKIIKACFSKKSKILDARTHEGLFVKTFSPARNNYKQQQDKNAQLESNKKKVEQKEGGETKTQTNY